MGEVIRKVGFRLWVALILVAIVVVMFGLYMVSERRAIVDSQVTAARNLVVMSESVRENMAQKWDLGLFSTTELRRIHDTETDPALRMHGGLSPYHVIIGFDGEVRLIDFGLTGDAATAAPTEANVEVTGVHYQAPEVLAGEGIDFGADQFAVAVMAVELLIGHRFYESRTTTEVQHLAQAGGFRPAAFATLPEPLRIILDKALATRVAERFGSCRDLREALMALTSVAPLAAL